MTRDKLIFVTQGVISCTTTGEERRAEAMLSFLGAVKRKGKEKLEKYGTEGEIHLIKKFTCWRLYFERFRIGYQNM